MAHENDPHDGRSLSATRRCDALQLRRGAREALTRGPGAKLSAGPKGLAGGLAGARCLDSLPPNR
jgi:hypothetical protein